MLSNRTTTGVRSNSARKQERYGAVRQFPNCCQLSPSIYSCSPTSPRSDRIETRTHESTVMIEAHTAHAALSTVSRPSRSRPATPPTPLRQDQDILVHASQIARVRVEVPAQDPCPLAGQAMQLPRIEPQSPQRRHTHGPVRLPCQFAEAVVHRRFRWRDTLSPRQQVQSQEQDADHRNQAHGDCECESERARGRPYPRYLRSAYILRAPCWSVHPHSVSHTRSSRGIAGGSELTDYTGQPPERPDEVRHERGREQRSRQCHWRYTHRSCRSSD